jgi:hypothetical protein
MCPEHSRTKSTWQWDAARRFPAGCQSSCDVMPAAGSSLKRAWPACKEFRQPKVDPGTQTWAYLTHMLVISAYTPPNTCSSTAHPPCHRGDFPIPCTVHMAYTEACCTHQIPANFYRVCANVQCSTACTHTNSVTNTHQYGQHHRQGFLA